ncbi:hypothetical protein [Thomasclavelia sp.]
MELRDIILELQGEK